jgi:hypothetical protein
MRKQQKNSRISTVLAVAMAILVTTLVTPAFAALSSTSVVGTSVNGSGVTVTVRNNTLMPQTTTVAVQAVVGDTAIWSYVPVVLLPYQTVTVSVGFVGAVSAVAKVGITDGDNPY